MRPKMFIYTFKQRLKSIPIISSLVFKKNQLVNRRTIDEYHKEGPRVASDVCELLERVGIEAWLHAGSLLGAVRDGEFIAWDNDLDLCVVADGKFEWPTIENVLQNAGYEKIREFTCDGRITEEAFAFGESHFDIFAMEPIDSNMARLFLYKRLPNITYDNKDQISVMYIDTYIPYGKRHINISGWDIPVPENAESLLEKQYGPNWRTPDPTYKESSAFKLLDSALGMKSFYLR